MTESETIIVWHMDISVKGQRGNRNAEDSAADPQ